MSIVKILERWTQLCPLITLVLPLKLTVNTIPPIEYDTIFSSFIVFFLGKRSLMYMVDERVSYM